MDIDQSSIEYFYDNRDNTTQDNNKKIMCSLKNSQYSYFDNSHSQNTNCLLVSNDNVNRNLRCYTTNIDRITSTQVKNQVYSSYQNRSLNYDHHHQNKVTSLESNDGYEYQRTVLQKQQHSFDASDYSDSIYTNNNNNNSIKSKSSSTDLLILIDNMDYSILSNLANIFVQRIKALRYVHELFCVNEYPDSFTGQEAVTVLYSILNEKIPQDYCIKIANALMNSRPALFEPVHYSQKSLITGTVYNSHDEIYNLPQNEMYDDDIPRGILTSLTKCYTYGCKYGKKKNGCYAPLCPNKPEIFKYEFLFGSSLSRQNTMMSTISINKETSYPHKAWAERVPIELLESITQRERDRQEAINELIYSEEVYRNDLNTLHELVVVPLLNSKTIIPNAKKRIEFVKQVFNNYNELRDISSALIKDLFRLQRRHKQKCLPSIGDVIIQHIRFFERPFTTYCSHVPLSEYFIARECYSNPQLNQFLYKVVPKEDRFRRLAFRHFLLNPVTRMQRYKLLLSAVLKKTVQGHPDHTYLTRCIDIINDIAKKSDLTTANFEKWVEISKINDSLIFNQGEMYDLQLDHSYIKKRKLYHKGELKRKPIINHHPSSSDMNTKKKNSSSSNNNKPDIYAFVFDHVLLMTKLLKSTTDNNNVYHVWKQPIPLQMLFIEGLDDNNNNNNNNIINNNNSNNNNDDDGKKHCASSNGLSRNKLLLLKKSHGKNNHYPLVLHHLGQRKKVYTFYCHSLEEKVTWMKAIKKAKDALIGCQNENDLFELRILSNPVWYPVNTLYEVGDDSAYYKGLINSN